jgi:hypothetical protein
LVEGWSLAANELNAIDDFRRGVVEIVHNDDLVICLEESKSSEGADVASATTKSQSSVVTWELELELEVG